MFILNLPAPQDMESVEVINSLGVARDVPAQRFLEQIDDLMRVIPPEEVSGERVSACHVDQAISWFEEEYKVFPQWRPLYCSEYYNSGSSHRSRTWHQRPGQAICVPEVELVSFFFFWERVMGVPSGSPSWRRFCLSWAENGVDAAYEESLCKRRGEPLGKKRRGKRR